MKSRRASLASSKTWITIVRAPPSPSEETLDDAAVRTTSRADVVNPWSFPMRSDVLVVGGFFFCREGGSDADADADAAPPTPPPPARLDISFADDRTPSVATRPSGEWNVRPPAARLLFAVVVETPIPLPPPPPAARAAEPLPPPSRLFPPRPAAAAAAADVFDGNGIAPRDRVSRDVQCAAARGRPVQKHFPIKPAGYRSN